MADKLFIVAMWVDEDDLTAIKPKADKDDTDFHRGNRNTDTSLMAYLIQRSAYDGGRMIGRFRVLNCETSYVAAMARLADFLHAEGH